MKQLHEVIEVPAPLEQAFRYTADFANIEQWDPGVTESQKISTGPLGPGSRFRVVVKAGLSRTAMEYVIKEFEPPHRIVLEGEGGSVHAVDEIRFTATGAGTRIDYTADISLGGLAGLAEPFMGAVLERVGRQALAGLQRALSEKGSPPAESTVRNLADRLILPGAFGFTRLGFESRKRHWKPLPEILDGRTAVVTGATSGLGRVTAERLASLGARVVLVGRDAGKLETAREEIVRSTGNEDLRLERADLGLVAEVKALATRLKDDHPSIHILVNNAAVLPTERTVTDEGVETAFATDLLSPWLLTRLLIPRLQESAPARIVNVLSGGMYLSGLNVDDLEFENGNYDGSRAYAQAKRGLMVLTELWAEELAGTGVVVNAMHPGWADTPGVRGSLPGFYRLTRKVLRTPEQGADTIVWLAAADEAGEVSGKFWLDREPHLSAILPGTAGTQTQRERLVEELTRRAA
ncbi:MAG: SDR family NAD(P)-dependent oxidoreductase [Gammaproteobacteria bacterium]|nr:SDR family NAD(P)-dependent oxidoreductase [Gammaproteobacteria bacterium]